MTSEARQQLLLQNEDFELTTGFSGGNFTEYRRYWVTGGELRYRSSGKTSWADSRFDGEYVATDEQTHRFLREHLDELNTDGL
ncbi:hypothetical protein ABZX93_32760 [Streptomyces sp. NPDC006632]|uniref:hypothetical protein n=1 Tax=Streptomyces sp. NPDC006632 TaxID=3157182 RepID=UPI0033AC9828